MLRNSYRVRKLATRDLNIVHLLLNHSDALVHVLQHTAVSSARNFWLCYRMFAKEYWHSYILGLMVYSLLLCELIKKW